MTPTEAIPLIVVVFLLLSSSGVQPDEIQMQFDGDATLEGLDEVHIVAGGTATVPAEAAVEGRIFVLDGRLDVNGAVEGEVTQLGGTVTVPETGSIAGEFQTIAGASSVADEATIGTRTVFDLESEQGASSPRGLFVLVQLLVLGGLGYLVARWRPDLFETVGTAVAGHPGVSVVTGGFAGAVALVLLIFMAFTLILLPASILGLALLLASMAFGQVAIGYRLTAPLPITRPTRRAVAGAVIIVLAFEAIGLVPFVGSLVVGAITVTGLGAVLVTYYGIRRFEPPHIPGPAE